MLSHLSPTMQRNTLMDVKASAASPTADDMSVPKSPAISNSPSQNCDPVTPETPMPDYEEEMPNTSQRRKSFTFVNNFQNVIFNIRTIDELYSCFPEPDPDYINDEEENSHLQDFPAPPVLTAEELSAAVAEAYDMHIHNSLSPMFEDLSAADTDSQLIKPKPLHNPCLESRERQALHKELLMNYKIGKDVLHRPELDRVLRERRERERKKEWDGQKACKGRTSLEIKLEERANRLKEEEDKKMKVITDVQAPELTRVHRKIVLKSTGSSEQI